MFYDLRLMSSETGDVVRWVGREACKQMRRELHGVKVKVKVKVTLRLTVSQSVSMSWCRTQSGTLTRVFFFKVIVLSFWGALSDERSGLSFVSLWHCSLQ
jgi:hypothetical protein